MNEILPVLIGFTYAFLTLAFGAASFFGFMMKGNRRWVKICFSLFILFSLAGIAAITRVVSVAKYTAIFIIVFSCLLSIRIAKLKFQGKYILNPANPNMCPFFARKRIDELTESGIEKGFQFYGDFINIYYSGKEEKSIFLRVMINYQRTMLYTINAFEKPNGITRCISSILENGIEIITFDKITISSLMFDPGKIIQHIYPQASIEEMCLKQQDGFNEAMQNPLLISEPLAYLVKNHNDWTERMAAINQLKYIDEFWLEIPKTHIPGMLLKFFLKLFY